MQYEHPVFFLPGAFKEGNEETMSLYHFFDVLFSIASTLNNSPWVSLYQILCVKSSDLKFVSISPYLTIGLYSRQCEHVQPASLKYFLRNRLFFLKFIFIPFVLNVQK